MSNCQLLGMRILVTRAEEQAEELASKIEALGAKAIKLPLIKIEPNDDEKTLDEAIKKVLAQSYDWIVFTSVHGVRTFFERLRKIEIDPKVLSFVKFAVIGPATGKALEQFGFKPEAMPEKFTNESLADLFKQILKDCKSERPKRFLLWRAEGASEVLPKRLRQLNAIVDEVHAYRTIPNRLDERQLKEFVSEPIHIVTFTSPSTVRAFFEVLGKERAMEILEKATVAAIGPVTERACKEFGFSPQIVSEIHTIDGLVDAIVSWLKSRSR
ncbi:MAG: uroporphyrinogen-III synthase [Armatimonadota bacterium]|nr:uroporphyrinogen-III synthase [Armatimonadota bacterium]